MKLEEATDVVWVMLTHDCFPGEEGKRWVGSEGGKEGIKQGGREVGREGGRERGRKEKGREGEENVYVIQCVKVDRYDEKGGRQL